MKRLYKRRHALFAALAAAAALFLIGTPTALDNRSITEIQAFIQTVVSFTFTCLFLYLAGAFRPEQAKKRYVIRRVRYVKAHRREAAKTFSIPKSKAS